MSEFDSPIRLIAKAARLRSWAGVDEQLAYLHAIGRESVADGWRDADREKGRDRLPPLAAPDPVLLLDLPPEERGQVEVFDKYGGARWRKRRAA